MASLLAEGWVSSLYLYPSDQYCGYNSTTLDCYQLFLVYASLASQTYMYNIELQLDCERGTHVKPPKREGRADRTAAVE